MQTVEIEHAVPRPDILLGLVRADGVDMARVPEPFEDRLREVLDERARPLDPDEETVRTAVRDMLRNGRYKPTGRAKPASEYLLRAAEPGEAGGFPRINPPVDVCNYVSLKYLVPISLWDLDLAGSARFTFRLGRSGESYVFNQGGQAIELEDLIVGCRVLREPEGEPIVNPVKDSLATKTTPDSRRVAACIYTPEAAVSGAWLETICAEFGGLLAGTGAEVAWAVAAPGETVRL